MKRVLTTAVLGLVLLFLLLTVAVFAGCKKKETEQSRPTAAQPSLEELVKENVKKACDAGDGSACWKTYGASADDASTCDDVLKKISRASTVYDSQNKIGHMMFLDLWVRCKPSLNVKEITRLAGSLCASFKAKGKPEDAAFYCEQVLKVSPKNEWAKDQIGAMDQIGGALEISGERLSRAEQPVTTSMTGVRCGPSPTGRGGPMCLVPAGPFMMGCNRAVDKECLSYENPYHAVNVCVQD